MERNDEAPSAPRAKRDIAPDSREARLRAALRANLARRKQQARARDADPADVGQNGGMSENTTNEQGER